MPSVFNHENSCWGVKRAFCNVFHNELHEDVQNTKVGLTELGIAENPICPTPVNNSVHYSVSSNGYYGYQPHSFVAKKSNGNKDSDSVCECIDDNAMDVEENSNGLQTMAAGNQFMINCNILDSGHCQNYKRKRRMPDDGEDSLKRMRQEEPAETAPKLPTHINHQCGGGDGSCVKIPRMLTSRNKVDTNNTAIRLDGATSLLLKNTHGCELYLFERTCDY